MFNIKNIKGGIAFNTTSEELARYVGLKSSNVGFYVQTAILTLSVPTIKRPETVDGGNSADAEFSKDKILIYVKTK